MASLKENSIKNYIANIDFTSEDWKISKIKEDLRKFLGEEPGIDIIYQKDVMINELLGETKEITKVGKVQVVFTDLDDRLKKLEFII